MHPLQHYKIVLHGQNIIVDKSVVFKQELGEGKLSDSYIDMEASATPKTSNYFSESIRLVPWQVVKAKSR